MAFGALRLEAAAKTPPDEAIQLAEVEWGASTGRPAPQPAVLVRHMLAPYPAPAGETSRTPCALRPGQTLLADLRAGPGPDMPRPFHAVDVRIPWRVFDQIAEDARASPIAALAPDTGGPIADPTVTHLIGALLPALRAGGLTRPRYVDHLCLALADHLALRYGGLRPGAAPARGGLPPHVLRRSQDRMTADLRAVPSLAALAKACGLSSRHFARAFKDSTGVTPHRWLMGVRVRAAKSMMQASGARLAEIAPACGFADQSHLTRVFKREAGLSPAAWRRRNASTDIGAFEDVASQSGPAATSLSPPPRPQFPSHNLQEPG